MSLAGAKYGFSVEAGKSVQVFIAYHWVAVLTIGCASAKVDV